MKPHLERAAYGSRCTAQSAVEHSGIGHDIAYVNEDPRLFHLVIESSNEDWSVSVEEGVVGVPRSSQ